MTITSACMPSTEVEKESRIIMERRWALTSHSSVFWSSAKRQPKLQSQRVARTCSCLSPSFWYRSLWSYHETNYGVCIPS